MCAFYDDMTGVGNIRVPTIETLKAQIDAI